MTAVLRPWLSLEFDQHARGAVRYSSGRVMLVAA